jgi:cytochrome c oxidase subunit 2
VLAHLGQVLGHFERDLLSPGGAFFSAEDADSALAHGETAHAEGAFYVWTRAEVESLLSPEDAAIFCRHYGIESKGNADPRSDPHDEFAGKNIFIERCPPTQTASEFDLPLERVELIEIGLLIFYAIPAWATRVKAFPAESQAVVVKVVAEQFAWNVQYPGPDGKFGRTDIKLVSADNPLGLDRSDPNAKDDITTINQLNLPIDRPVLVHLSSKDVIHSFGLYEMRVKQDAIPGMTIPVWFIPNRAGEYEIACSQLCGLGHFRMRGFITIQSAADYQKWYDDQEKELRPAPAATAAP